MKRNPNATAQEIEVELSSWEQGVTDSSDAAIKDLVPYLNKYGVDLYLAGHWHYYESLWPATDGTTGAGGKVLKKSYVNPKKTIHVTTGNGGPPGKTAFADYGGSIGMTNKQSEEFGYGRLVAHNSSHLTYKQIQNKDRAVFDSFVLVKDTHPPFETDFRL
jgi:hypothetical protein